MTLAPTTTRQAIAEAVRILEARGIESPREHADILLAELLGTTRAGLVARAREPLAPEVLARYDALVARRAAREPLQHILGHWPFLELELTVDRRALIPRPETEDLALAARYRLPDDRPSLAADVGTGTGCIALALAEARTAARVLALDASADALALAAENVARCGAEGRVVPLRCDLLGAVAPGAGLDVVVANLPYVREDELADLEPEVRDHDPLEALVAPDRGLALIRRLIAEAPARLAPGGSLLLEMAPDQVPVIAAELAASGRWTDVRVLRDHLCRERIVAARLS